MRVFFGSCLLIGLLACNGGGTSANETCPSYASAGGNRSSNPSYEWDQLNCACTPSQTGGTAAGGSCSGPQECAKVCCTCPGGSGWTFGARACRDTKCLDQAAACQAVLDASGRPCQAQTPQG